MIVCFLRRPPQMNYAPDLVRRGLKSSEILKLNKTLKVPGRMINTFHISESNNTTFLRKPAATVPEES